MIPSPAWLKHIGVHDDGERNMPVKNKRSTLVLSLFLLLQMATISGYGLAQTPDVSTQGLTPAEDWISKKVALGEPADLVEHFPSEKDRVLSSSFLEKLVTGQIKDGEPTRHGVLIGGGIVMERIDLRNALVSEEIILSKFVFAKSVDFSNATFVKGLYMIGSVFRSGIRLRGVHAQNVSLKDAVLAGPVDFTDARLTGFLMAVGAKFVDEAAEADFSNVSIGLDAYLDSAVFRGSLYFNYARIAGSLEAKHTKFVNAAKEIVFNGMEIGGSAFFDEASFAGFVDFSWARISKNYQAQGIKFTNPAKTVGFNRTRVDGTVFLQGAQFSGPVNFISAKIAGNLDARNAVFGSHSGKVDFNDMQVDGNVFFHDTEFSGPLSLANAAISGNLEMLKARFLNRRATASFAGVTIKRYLLLMRSRFSGPVNFSGATIGQVLDGTDAIFEDKADFVKMDVGNNLVAVRAEFRNTGEAANFNSVKIGGDLFIEDAKFFGSTNFVVCQVSRNFSARRAEHRSNETPFDLWGMTVDGNAVLDDAILMGPVNLGGAVVTGELHIRHAQLLHAKQPLVMDRIKVGGTVDLSDTRFAYGLHMTDGRVGSLLLNGPPRATNQRRAAVSTLDISQTMVEGELQVTNWEIETMVGNSIQVRGPAVLRGISVEKLLSLEDGRFASLMIEDLSWSKSASINLADLTYAHINGGESERDWKALLRLLERAEYDTGSYLYFEAFLKGQGYGEQADKVFVAGRDRWARQSGGIGRRAWSLFLKYFIYYGRWPWLAFLWSFSYFLFFRDKTRMEPVTPDAAPEYNGIWYAVDLFVPALNLRIAEKWYPKPERRFGKFARHWTYIMRIVGWILVPIGLLAWTGFIK